MALTIAAVAEHKKITAHKVEVTIRMNAKENGRQTVSSYEVLIDLGHDLSKREQAILFNSARNCDVHKILEGKSSFNINLLSEN